MKDAWTPSILIATVVLAELATSNACSPARSPERELLSRASPETFFRAPSHDQVRISPDGQHIAFLRPEHGIVNVWVAPSDAMDTARRVTSESDGVRSFRWGRDGTRIVYAVDHDGDEQTRLRVVGLEGAPARDLVVVPGAAARLLGLLPDRDEALVAIDDRDREFDDVYAVNLSTGLRRLAYRNERRYSELFVDADATLQLGIALQAGGRASIRRIAAPSEPVLLELDADDATTTRILSIDSAHDRAFVADARSSDRTCLYELRLSDGQRSLAFPEQSADLVDVVFSSRDGSPLAIAYEGARKEWVGTTPEARADVAFLRSIDDGELTVDSMSLDDRRWVVSFEDDAPRRHYLYDRVERHATLLFPDEAAPRVSLTVSTVVHSDGFDVVSYVTRPIPPSPSSLAVVLVHGGPWMRDDFPPPPLARFLAGAGYTVVRTNFRGSTGFGKRFAAAGNREWGGKMLDDVRAAVGDLASHDAIDPRRLAVMGSSYGGYAALMLSASSNLFRCAVDISGPTDLLEMLRTIPPELASQLEQAVVRVGDFRTEVGREALLRQSPSRYVDSTRSPLLIVQGHNDRLVGAATTRPFAQRSIAMGRPTTYVEFEHEGHQIRGDGDRLALASILRHFFDVCFERGEIAPLSLFGAALSAPIDGGAVPGLAAAIADDLRAGAR